MAPSGTVDKSALADSTCWLSTPDQWDKNGGDGPFSDKGLARIQFAAALVDAIKVGAVKDRKVLIAACDRLVKDQAKDGSWGPEGPDTIGSPATLGRPLATFTVREILKAADPERFDGAIKQANAWLLRVDPQTTLDAAVILLAALHHPRQARARDLIRRGQSDGGGWGPYPDATPEAFDTALVLISLLATKDKETDAMKKARGYLIKSQLDDGSWPETTRPSGNESYAQRVSTAGWATRALLLSQSLQRPSVAPGPETK